MSSTDPFDPSAPSESEHSFSSSWDAYVDQAAAAGQDWPGDDWGDARLWDAWFDRLFRPHEVADWQRAVEIGQGTGKYTRRVLDAGCREVLAADVSQRFLDLCRRRQQDMVDAGRLHLAAIDEREAGSLPAAVEAKGWTGQVDAFFSIDTLVHLSWTQIVALMSAATLFLRPGGWLIFSYADGTTEAGFQKMMADIPRTLAAAGDPTTGCFHWVAPSLVEASARRLGFEIVLNQADPEHHRDGHCVARFTDPELAAAARALLP